MRDQIEEKTFLKNDPKKCFSSSWVLLSNNRSKNELKLFVYNCWLSGITHKCLAFIKIEIYEKCSLVSVQFSFAHNHILHNQFRISKDSTSIIIIELCLKALRNKTITNKIDYKPLLINVKKEILNTG